MSIKLNRAFGKSSMQQLIDKAKGLINERKFLEAETLAKEVLSRSPKSHVFQQILGIALSEQNDPDKTGAALEACAAAVQGQPDNPHYVNMLANVTAQLGNFEKAEELYNQVLELSPGLPDAMYNLAKVWTRTGKFLQARDVFQQMLPVISDVTDIYQNLGACEFSLGNVKQALLWFKLTLGFLPDNFEAHKNYAVCLNQMGDYAGALEHFNLSLELGNPDYSVLLNIAYAHSQLNEPSAAESFAEAYLEVDENMLPLDRLNCLTLLASVKKTLGKDVEANDIYRKIIDEFDDQAWAYSNYLFTRILMETETQESLFEKHVDFARRYELPVKELWGGYTNAPDPERKLKVGYVSADFFSHSVSYFSLPLIANHDKSRFEVHCYSAREIEKDPVMRRIRREVLWHDIQGKNPIQVAEMVREDQIDLLIDLSGHTGGNQLLAFARKPAPVQLTWIGYPFSTGLSAIDYRIVDNHIEPEGISEHISSEKLLRIDGCFCAYRPSVSRPFRLTSGELDVRPTPALESGFITFGCCNNFNKVNEFTLLLWAKVLERIPSSKLLLEVSGAEKEDVRSGVESKVQAAGIDLDRLIISNRQKNPQYMLYHSIDIVLDPYPCNGGTTTCDALFMSVPVVSLQGDRFMSRLGATFISNAGHPEWVAKTEEEYIDIACHLAHDIDRLDRIRQNLRHEVERSPMMDEIGFARKLERAYRQVWQKWCLDQVNQSDPEAVSVDSEVKNTEARVDALMSSNFDRNAYAAYLSEIKQFIDKKDWNVAAAALEHIADAPLYVAEHAYYLALIKIQHSKSISMASPIANQWMDEAATLLKSALEQAPEFLDAWLALGELQIYRNRYEEAEISMMRALKISPDSVHGLLYLALLLAHRNDFPGAHERCSRAKKLNPELAFAYDVEATIYAKEGNSATAIQCAEQAVQLDPNNLSLVDKLLGYAVLSDKWTKENFQEYSVAYSNMLAQNVHGTAQHSNQPVPSKKLNVGLISGHFYDNHWSSIWLPLCELISRTEIELFIYHNGEVVDQAAYRLQRAVKNIRYIRGLNPATTAALLMDDQIDILIALDAYGEYSCVPVLAQHAAPIQMAWPQENYALPVGLINYALRTSSSVPSPLLSEQHKTAPRLSVPGQMNYIDTPLPFSYQPFMNNPEFYSMPVFNDDSLPCEKAGHITFGVQADAIFITDTMLNAWASILLRLPESKLKLCATATSITYVKEALIERGIASDRIKTSYDLRDTRYHFYLDVDIALDTSPANSSVHVMDALWMGVPVLGLHGSQPWSHMSANLLSLVQLDDWVANGAEELVERAIERSTDIAVLADLRHSLRKRLEASGLLDCSAFAKSFAQALRMAWIDWCQSDAASYAHHVWHQRDLLDQAEEKMTEEDYLAASVIYMDVLKLEPMCGYAMYGLGLAYLMMQEDLGLARELLSRAAAKLEQDATATSLAILPDCLVSLAHACYGLGLLQDARGHFRHSLAYRDSEQVRQWMNQLAQAIGEQDSGSDGLLH